MRGLSGCIPRSVTVLISTAFLMAGGVEARAEQRLQVELTQAGVAKPTMYPITPDDRHDYFATLTEWQAPELEDPASPFRGLHGRCFGSIEYRGETIVTGGGYCTYEDADGDRLVTRWTPKEELPDGTRGEWTVFDGSGKWEGASGSGAYLAGGERDALSRRLTGEIVLPDP